MDWFDVIQNIFAAIGGLASALGGYVLFTERRDVRNRKPTEAQLLYAAGQVIKKASEARARVHALQVDEWQHAYVTALGLPPLEVHGPTLAGAPPATWRQVLRNGEQPAPIGTEVARGIISQDQAIAIRQAYQRPTIMYSDGLHVMSQCGCRLCVHHRAMMQKFSAGGVV